jgi:hypothetical protein
MSAAMSRFSDAQPIYAEHGIVTFPVTVEKKPAIRNFLKMGPKASKDLTTSKQANAPAIGFATNQRNGITVLDVDTTDEKVLADAVDRHGYTPLIARTGSGKFHAYYRHNGERRTIRPWSGRPIDLLGRGGFVVAPPSRVTKGKYCFIEGSLDDVSRLPTLRNLDLSEPTLISIPDVLRQKPTVITEGQRNTELWRHCMRAGHHVDSFDALLDVARTFNQDHCEPPMEDSRVISTAKSVWGYTQRGLNRFGQHGAWFPIDEVHRLIDGDQDVALLLMFMRAQQGPDATFMCANGLAEKFDWTRKRLADARSRLIELGYMAVLRNAGPKAPALFRWRRSE